MANRSCGYGHFRIRSSGIAHTDCPNESGPEGPSLEQVGFMEWMCPEHSGVKVVNPEDFKASLERTKQNAEAHFGGGLAGTSATMIIVDDPVDFTAELKKLQDREERQEQPAPIGPAESPLKRGRVKKEKRRDGKVECSTCGVPKLPREFPKNATKKQKHDSECRRCKRERSEAYRNSAEGRDAVLERKYSITSATYDAMFKKQKGLCAGCGLPESTMGRNGDVIRLAVDHDHATGAVRGLLCRRCNTGLGHFNDDHTRLIKLVAYLTKSR